MIHFHKWEYYDLWDGNLRVVSSDYAEEVTKCKKHYPYNIGLVFFRKCSKCGKCQQTVLAMGASWVTPMSLATKQELEALI